LKKDIPALRLSDGKLWFKEKTYKHFAKASCGLSNKEYQIIVSKCCEAVKITKLEVDGYTKEHPETKAFLDQLQSQWKDTISHQ
jgi:serine/threonine-protein kinase HipA